MRSGAIILLFVAITHSQALFGAGTEENRRQTLAFVVVPGNDLIGNVQLIHTGEADALADIGERHAVGYRELQIANPGIDPWLPGKDASIVLPQQFLLPDAPRDGIVLNTAEMRVYYFPGGQNLVISYPASIGRGAWQTPLGQTTIISKTVEGWMAGRSSLL